MKVKKTIDELLQEPYWIIDILPGQVPKDSPGQYFAVEKYFLAGDRLAEIKQKHINLILSEPDDTHMTVFDPDERLLHLITEIAGSEGLFTWKPPQ